jgi:hypothetical protein
MKNLILKENKAIGAITIIDKKTNKPVLYQSVIFAKKDLNKEQTKFSKIVVDGIEYENVEYIIQGVEVFNKSAVDEDMDRERDLNDGMVSPKEAGAIRVTRGT